MNITCRKRHQGTLPQSAAFDLLHGSAVRQRDEVELYPTRLAISIPFGKTSHPETAVFTPDGASLITGSVDGFVEVWDVATGKLRKDLPYQADEQFMMHEKPVLCLAVSNDGVAVASGALAPRFLRR
jgi:WD40 repeat-containing protein SMU1